MFMSSGFREAEVGIISIKDELGVNICSFTNYPSGNAMVVVPQNERCMALCKIMRDNLMMRTKQVIFKH